ncbi:MAG: DUF427 domain-containing protein [Rubrivivax sp.]|nr:MAG: DUF427 domain-containing protein [Rubrivivax sp.]
MPETPAKSPGHREHPEHRVVESRVAGRMTVELGGTCLADSRDVVRLEEDGHPARFYFPRDDVQMQFLKPSSTTTTCPFKGRASYFSLRTEGAKADDAVWSYEEPYAEHVGLTGRLAFDESTSEALLIRSLP